jgi:hypothetical protein
MEPQGVSLAVDSLVDQRLIGCLDKDGNFAHETGEKEYYVRGKVCKQYRLMHDPWPRPAAL